ncbi:MAG: sugar phosphate nucleotidyltransferase [Candidatus Bathyarchaeota archaeon]
MEKPTITHQPLASHLLKETFLVLQGDAFTTIDLAGALDFHRRSRADATIILKEVSDPWLYGVVLCNSEGDITSFQEKPQKGEELSNLASTGMYCLEPEVLDLVTPWECDFAKNVFPRLLSEGKRLFGFIAKGNWVDIGSLKGYLEGTRQVLEARIKEQRNNIPEGVLTVKKVTIDGTIVIREPVLIDDDVSLAKYCQIGPYVVLKNGVKVGEKTVLENAVVLENSALGSSCRILESIIGERAALANNIFVDGSIIGPGSLLEDLVQTKSGSRVWPGIRVKTNTSVEGTLVLPMDKPFYFHLDVGKFTGVTASTIIDLITTLQTVPIESVEFHLYRRDFERWIRDVFQANMLTEEISVLRKEDLRGEELRRRLVKTIKSWYEYSIELDLHRWYGEFSI